MLKYSSYQIIKYGKFYFMLFIQIVVILTTLTPTITNASAVYQQVQHQKIQIDQYWVFNFMVQGGVETYDSEKLGVILAQLYEHEQAYYLEPKVMGYFEKKEGLQSYNENYDLEEGNFLAVRGAQMDKNALDMLYSKNYPEYPIVYTLEQSMDEIPLLIGSNLQAVYKKGDTIEAYYGEIDSYVQFSVLDYLPQTAVVTDFSSGTMRQVDDNSYIMPRIKFAKNMYKTETEYQRSQREDAYYDILSTFVRVEQDSSKSYVGELQRLSAIFSEQKQHIIIRSNLDDLMETKKMLDTEIKNFFQLFFIIILINICSMGIIILLIMKKNQYENSVMFLLGRTRKKIIGIQHGAFTIIQLLAIGLAYPVIIFSSGATNLQVYLALNLALNLCFLLYLHFIYIRKFTIREVMKLVK